MWISNYRKSLLSSMKRYVNSSSMVFCVFLYRNIFFFIKYIFLSFIFDLNVTILATWSLFVPSLCCQSLCFIILLFFNLNKVNVLSCILYPFQLLLLIFGFIWNCDPLYLAHYGKTRLERYNYRVIYCSFIIKHVACLGQYN